MMIAYKLAYTLFVALILSGCSAVNPSNPAPESLKVNGIDMYKSFFETTGVSTEELKKARTWKGKCTKDYIDPILIRCELGDARRYLGYTHKAPYTKIFDLAFNDHLDSKNVGQIKIRYHKGTGKIYFLRIWPDRASEAYQFFNYLETLESNATAKRNKGGVQGYLFGNEYLCFIDKKRSWESYGCTILGYQEN